MRKWVVLLVVLTLLSSLIIGCGQGDKETAPANSEKQVEKGDKNSEIKSSNPLEQLVQQAMKAKNMSFDIQMTMDSAGTQVVSTGKMYMSENKTRMEMESMGMKMITIINDKDEVYMYNPANNTALKMTTPEESTETPDSWLEDAAEMEIIGDEKMDGYDCLVATMTEDDIKSKMWLRKDIGMPVRVEQNTPEGNMVIEYKNYDLSPQPDDLFEVPANATITTMP